MKIPVNKPIISTEAKKNVLRALQSGWLSSAGPFVAEFEKNFAGYVGRKEGIAVSSGTAALHTALLSLGIGKGDEVIVPAFTMAACFLAVIHTGAKPIFIDAELETYNIDPKKIEEKITPRTKAIMAVHLYGHPAEMDLISEIGKKHNIPIIEDAAQAHGAELNNRKCGSLGLISCFSFYANKLIATGEGGMIVTDDPILASKARRFRDLHHSEKKRFVHDGLGFNYRMTNIQAGIGLGELKNIEKYLRKKEKMAALYERELRNVPGLKLPKKVGAVRHSYWMYAIVVDEKKFGMDRNKLRATLLQKGIDTRDFFYPPEDQPVLRSVVGNEIFPNAKYLGENGLYLPSGLAITPEEIKYVTETIREVSPNSKTLLSKGRRQNNAARKAAGRLLKVSRKAKRHF